ncbi:restriction endonuclease [Paucibacter sp. XJ19-41]|uniref:restriction endonuclease n=1 Tax=Paucibacter sp. XJ19-41 TaxID=2927824 RepID=UPI0023491785|nr:restriction endonuclease [Paucibacter sp. XJ19-41]MDC6167534.1 restriction endonuclease [Paucibacter sp. XJ19-41]
MAAAERERKRSVRAAATQGRQVERQQRMALAQQSREDATAAKQAKAQYLQDRQGEVDDLNAEVKERIDAIQSILAHTLGTDDRISFESLRIRTRFAAFKLPTELTPATPSQERAVPPLSWAQKLVPGAASRQARLIEQARSEHQADLASFHRAEAVKQAEAAKARDDHERRKAEFEADQQRRNAEVDEFEADYLSKEPEAIVAYNEMVLTRSEYPEEGFPQGFRLAYNPAASELVVEYELPLVSVVPAEAEYRYVKSRDVIEAKDRKASETKQLYQDLVAAVTLRTLHELFEADQAQALNLVTFTGILDTIDPANGREVRVPVVSVRATKAEFEHIRLDKVDKIACLRNLGAQVSSRPDELQAVKPIVEFNMVDKRFIEQGDALSGLESRPNLMDLTPSEFEILVSNLFGKMGLETKLTRSSRDGGVDAVAFDTRPVLGGKVVIQAKRYRDTVGVSAVRDLYGTMLNEGASKGILVCTSGYGVDAYNFSKDKPLELIDGGGLLYLLREHAGTHARIAI